MDSRHRDDLIRERESDRADQVADARTAAPDDDGRPCLAPARLCSTASALSRDFIVSRRVFLTKSKTLPRVNRLESAHCRAAEPQCLLASRCGRGR